MSAQQSASNESFVQDSLRSSPSGITDYRRNIIHFCPVVTFYRHSWSVGLGYERVLGKSGRWSINLLVYIGLKPDMSGIDAGYDYRGQSQINPGVNFYPQGQKKIVYGIGMSCFFTSEEYIYRHASGGYFSNHYRGYQSGIMVNNSVLFNITPRLNTGMKSGIGASLLNEVKDIDNRVIYSVDATGMFYFNFHIGYRL